MDPYYFGKLDPDPHHQSEKLDPDRDQFLNSKSGTLEARNGAAEGLDAHNGAPECL
jgi:hypothetical protein